MNADTRRWNAGSKSKATAGHEEHEEGHEGREEKPEKSAKKQLESVQSVELQDEILKGR